MTVPQKHLSDLNTLFASVRTKKEADILLRDILTPQELRSVAQRWQLIQELHKGLAQRDIVQKLHISVSKVTRGSRMMKYGSGGFKHFLKKLKIKKP
jgi:TrpR family trp operon transcriptional repressor